MLTKSERIDVITVGFKAGRTLQAIGDEVGLSRERVRQIAREFGLERPAREPKPARQPSGRRRGRPSGACAAARAECRAAGLPDPYQRYKAHERGAEKRGIPFRMTFDEWWAMWKPHFANRGRQKGQLVMARYLDQGAYEVGNVEIKTVLENAHERSLSGNLRHVR